MYLTKLLGVLLASVGVLAAQMPAAVAVKDIDKIFLKLEGIREKCLVEELPEKTVLLVKHSATSWRTSDNVRVDAPLQILVTVRDPAGHTIVRQQSKNNDRLFLTATTTGDYLICFQAMLTQYSPNLNVKLGLEVFIGNVGEPEITSPVEAQLSELAFQISKAVDQASDLQREQTLQRDREHHFRSMADKINRNVVRFAIFQAIVLLGVGVYQVHSLRRFFRYKKLI